MSGEYAAFLRSPDGVGNDLTPPASDFEQEDFSREDFTQESFEREDFEALVNTAVESPAPRRWNTDAYRCGLMSARDEHDRWGYRAPYPHAALNPRLRRGRLYRQIAVEFMAAYGDEWARLMREDAAAGRAA